MQLALRLWTGEEMIYPVKFSVMYDPNNRNSSVRAFVKNEKFITFDYMMITPFKAINGNIFEKDIIILDNDENKIGVVEFDSYKGVFVCHIKDNDDIILNADMNIEVAGNIYEDKVLIEPEPEPVIVCMKQYDEPIGPMPLKEEIKEQVEEQVEETVKDTGNNSLLQDDIVISDELNIEINDENTLIVEDTNDDKNEIIEDVEIKDILKNSSDEPVNMKIYFISSCNDIGTGGYVFTFACDDIKDTYKGSESNTNEKKIDLSGIISSLEMLDGKFNVTIYTTSQYVIYPFIKKWVYKWYNSNWYKNDTDRIQNYELWEQLFNLCEKYHVKWEFVKELNDDMKECKKLADLEIK